MAKVAAGLNRSASTVAPDAPEDAFGRDHEALPALVVGDAPGGADVANLVDNAVEHNVPGGWVRVESGCTVAGAFLTVTNSGPVVPGSEVERLFEPLSVARP